MRRLLGLAVAFLPAIALGQMIESIEVRVTNVDVVVTDRAGKPVTGLTKDDFEIYENGKRQTITNFDAIERNRVAPPAADALAAPAAAAPVEIDEQRKRRIIFFLDTESLDPAQRNRIINVLDGEMARLIQPGDEATIVVWRHRPVIVQPFTSDLAALQKSLREQTSLPGNNLLAGRSMLEKQIYTLLNKSREDPSTAMDYYNTAHDLVDAYADEIHHRQQRIVRGLSTTVSRLAGVEGKKVMVFATGALPERAGLEIFQWLENLFRPVVPVVPVGKALIDASLHSITLDLQRLAKQANTDGVTLYFIDAGNTMKNGVENGVASDSSVDFLERSNTADGLRRVATQTGGIALSATDNFKVVIDTIARDLDACYSLGYRPDDMDPGDDRRIVVKVRRPGLLVRSRRSWAPKSLAEQMQDRVIANVFHSGIAGDFKVEVGLRSEPRKKDKSLVTLPLRVFIPSTLTLLPSGPEVAGGFSVYVVIGGPNGELSEVAKSDHSIRVPTAEEQDWRVNPLIWDVDLTVIEGKQTLSIAVVDRISNQTGYIRKTFEAH